MQKSLWQKYGQKVNLSSIKNDQTADIVIVGGGITGLTIAYNLKDSKYKIILLEADDFFSSTTCKSTGKVTYLQDLKYSDIESVYDFNTAKLYYESQKDAIKLIRKTVEDNLIDCDLRKVKTVTFTTDNSDIVKFKNEKSILGRLGVKYYGEPLSFDKKDIKDFIMVKNSYTFNPAKYIGALIKILDNSNVKLYQKSRVTKIKKEDKSYVLYANGFKISAKKIIVSCHYPFFTLPGFIPLKTYTEKSYICATKIEDENDYSCISSSKPVISFRYYNDMIDKYFIYLNCVSKTCDNLNYKKNYEKCTLLSKEITGKMPNFKWTNIDVMTNDFMPIVGRISDTEKNVFIATGYNTWGMTNGTIAGKIISNLVLGRKSKYANLFSPKRNIAVKRVINFAKNTLLGSVKSYGYALIRKNPSWYKNKTYIENVDGKRVGIYIDEKGSKHITSNTCPHLKCHLIFNEIDKTWDCPCHSSRFDIDGNIIKGPSSHNIKT